MRHIILQDDPLARENLFPFSLTRPVGDFRVGITILAEKWALGLRGETSFATEAYLEEKFPPRLEKDNIFIFSHLIPDSTLVEAISGLNSGQALYSGDRLLAWRSGGQSDPNSLFRVDFSGQPRTLDYPFQIFQLNAEMILRDFQELTRGRRSATIPSSNHLSEAAAIFVEPGARLEHCFLNASRGPIYIGTNTEIMEGAMIRGPFAMGEGSVVKMGAAIYGATTLGPHCRVGGEIKNTVVFGFSNKAHEGYLGDAVIGEWCNLGANTNCSNLKNNAGPVKIWNHTGKAYVNAGMKCGLLMGDFTRSGISTMFNTGTVAGVSCNIFGGDFPPKFIPSFSWGGSTRWMQYDKDKAIANAGAWMKMKDRRISPAEEAILRHLFQSATKPS